MGEKAFYRIMNNDNVDTTFHIVGKAKNEYRYLQVPISITYFKRYKDVFFGYTSGLSFGLLTHAQGLLPNTTVSDLVTINREIVHKTSVAWACNVECVYKINRMLSVFMLTDAQLYMKSILKEQVGVKQYPFSFGLGLGVRNRF